MRHNMILHLQHYVVLVVEEIQESFSAFMLLGGQCDIDVAYKHPAVIFKDPPLYF